METIVIFGSSRSDGNTKEALNAVISNREAEIVDLSQQDISYYDYENRNQDDDFLGIAEKMTKAKNIIFATPIYWYSMSAQLKTFFDRMTDLVTIRKDLGRGLKDRKCYLITSGAGGHIPEGMLEIFELTCKYLDMEFVGSFHYSAKRDESMNEDTRKDAKAFGDELFG